MENTKCHVAATLNIWKRKRDRETNGIDNQCNTCSNSPKQH